MLLPAGAVLPVLIALGVLSATWLVWALRGRRPLHPECPRCRHDLRGAPTLVCGECGHRAASAGALVARRRRWRQGALAAACAIAALIAAERRAPVGWWIAPMPTSVLLLCQGRCADPDGRLEAEVVDRLSLSDGLLAWSLVPARPRWEQRLAEAAARRGGGRTDRLKALCGIRPSDEADDRARWPSRPTLHVESPEAFIAEFLALSDEARSRGDSTTTTVSEALHRHLGHIVPDIADIGLTNDEADFMAEVLPVDSAEGSDEHRLVRVGQTLRSGHALWFTQESETGWTLAGWPLAVPGSYAYRGGDDNVRGALADGRRLVVACEHRGGGSGYFNEWTTVSDIGEGTVVLVVPRQLVSSGYWGSRRELESSLAFTDSGATLRCTLRFTGVEPGAPRKSPAHPAAPSWTTEGPPHLELRFKIHFRLEQEQLFRAVAVDWLGAPPRGIDAPHSAPLLGWWPTNPDEFERIHGVAPPFIDG